jgi:hypothetical protein
MSFSVKDAVGFYLPLMHELGSRIDLVGRFCTDQYGISFPYAREFVYLQLRQVCELIALGCLQLHGDLSIASSKSAKSEWNAGKIMHLLSKHHAHCFPQCVKREVSHQGWKITANHDPDALTYDEYSKLYNECGRYLHRGSIRSIKAAGPVSQNDFDNIIRWHRKIVSLMNEHLIGRSSAASFYLVSLRTTSGFPECSLFTKSAQNGMDVETYSMKIDESGYEHVILPGNMRPMPL